MKAVDIPGKFNIPFANAAGGGYIRAIPQASQIGIVDGAASLTDGFVPLNFLAVGAGGVPPFGQDFNGLMKQVTQWARWQSAGGPASYDSSFQTQIGGYPQSSIVQSAATAGTFWISTVDDNLTNPDAAGAGWLPWPSTQAMIAAGLQGNFKPFSTTTRLSMTGNAGNSYTVTAWTLAAYAKQVASSALLIKGYLPTLTPNVPAGSALLDILVDGVVKQTLSVANSQNNTLVISVGSTGVYVRVTGLAVGNRVVSFNYRRADATNWTGIFCPNSGDGVWYDATSQAIIELSEAP